MIVDVPNFEGLYKVSYDGVLYRLLNDTQTIISKPGEKRYLSTTLMNRSGKSLPFTCHRIMAMSFIPNPLGLKCINHKDEDPSNNCPSNLEWCTYSYNVNYSRKKAKEKASRVILSKDEIEDVFIMYKNGIDIRVDFADKCGDIDGLFIIMKQMERQRKSLYYLKEHRIFNDESVAKFLVSHCKDLWYKRKDKNVQLVREALLYAANRLSELNNNTK